MYLDYLFLDANIFIFPYAAVENVPNYYIGSVAAYYAGLLFSGYM